MAKRLLRIGLALTLPLLIGGCSSVVARVNGVDITRNEFHEELERAQGLSMLQATIMKHLMYERAKAEDLVPTAAEVDERFQEWKNERFKDDAEFRQWMKSEALDDTVILDSLKFDLTVFKLRTAHLSPSDKDLKDFFDEHRERMFDKPVRFTFRQIVLGSREEAQKMLHRLNTEELIFSDVARNTSLDRQTGAKGGLVENVDVAALKANAPSIYEALNTLKENEVYQKPVAVQGAYFIFKLLKKLPAEPADFNDPETKDLVKLRYLQVNAKSEEQLTQEVVQGADVVVLDPRYKAAIEPRFSGAAAALPPAVAEQLNQPVELTEPTEYDESEVDKVLEQSGAVGGEQPTGGTGDGG